MKRLPYSGTTNAYDHLTYVAKIIEEEPARIHMGHWAVRQKHILENLIKLREHAAQPACGTVGCIAGWISLTAGSTGEGVSPKHNAMSMITGHYAAATTMGADLERLFMNTEVYNRTGTRHLKPGTPAYAAQIAKRVRQFRDKYADELRARDFNDVHLAYMERRPEKVYKITELRKGGLLKASAK